MKRLCASTILAVACSKPTIESTQADAKSETAPQPEGGTKSNAKPDAKPDAKSDPCSAAALGLGTATNATPWQLPASCVHTPGKTWIASDDDAKATLGCDGAALGIDFTREAIFITSGMLSPAQTGSYPLDDGTKVTLVSRFRTPCPDDPRPMPTPFTSMFRMKAGPRSFGEASCTVPSACK